MPIPQGITDDPEQNLRWGAPTALPTVITSAPPPTNTSIASVMVGGGVFGGGAGSFGGVAAGTVIGINTPAGFTGDFFAGQINGSSRFRVDSTSSIWIGSGSQLLAGGVANVTWSNTGVPSFPSGLQTTNTVVTAAAAAGSAGQVVFGNATATTIGAAGGAAALPATPLGYLRAFIGATQVSIPYYNP